jgi:hypothetical protein
MQTLLYSLNDLFKTYDLPTGDAIGESIRIADVVTLTHRPETAAAPASAVLEWWGGSIGDIIADTVIAVVLQVCVVLACPKVSSDPLVKEAFEEPSLIMIAEVFLECMRRCALILWYASAAGRAPYTWNVGAG